MKKNNLPSILCVLGVMATFILTGCGETAKTSSPIMPSVFRTQKNKSSYPF